MAITATVPRCTGCPTIIFSATPVRTSDSPVSPASNLIFYGNATQGSGWTLSSSTVAEEIVLVYTKDERFATIEILRQRDRLGTLFGGENNSQITISVVHPGAIQEQNPYLALDPSRSIEQGSIVLTE